MSEFSGNPPHFGDKGREDRLRKSLFEEPDDPTGTPCWASTCRSEDCTGGRSRRSRLALASDPETALAHYVLSLSLARQFPRLRKIVEAIAEADEAIRLDPLLPSFYAQLAHLYLLRHSTSLQARDASAALRAAEAGLAVDPLAAHYSLSGNALGKLGRHEEAEAAFSTALALDPDEAYVRAIYGEYLFRRGISCGP